METMTAAVLQTAGEDYQIDHLIDPAGYRILVEIISPEDSLKRWQDSNLKMPPETKEREWQAQVWAKVLRLGPQAYQDKERFFAPWCKPGDHIMMRPYSGTRFMMRGHLYALINDDTVQAVIGDVSELERA